MHDPQSYDALADHYDHLSDVNGDALADWLPSVLPATGTTAVDLGCGTGRHAVQLAERFPRVLAVDLSEPMVALARERRPHPKVEYRAADMFSITGHFDFVFSSAMLHHVPDAHAALEHIRSLVAPGGRCVLVDVLAPSNRIYRTIDAVWPRLLYRVAALVDLVRDGAGAEARERYRVRTHHKWLDHLASDRFLTREQFDDAYGAVFPGATFVDRGFFRACVWDAPS